MKTNPGRYGSQGHHVIAQVMENHLLILTAPPASGKTYLIENLINHLGPSFIVISPLRALANECLAKWGARTKVVTPEEYLLNQDDSKIVILDEFHLFYYWGDTFRPRMWEAFYDCTYGAELVILLTATLNVEMQEEIKKFSCHFSQLSWINFGNQQLKNVPKRYYRFHQLESLKKILYDMDFFEGTSLIFCKYRSEVEKWEKILFQRGYSVWTCVGGEAGEFSQRAQNEKTPNFIIATTVLSHGVNLPQISRIFFLYQVNNLDFWIQMVARGGRRGESYEVYALENPMGIDWSWLLNHLAILRLSLRMKWKYLIKQIQEWFLKA